MKSTNTCGSCEYWQLGLQYCDMQCEFKKPDEEACEDWHAVIRPAQEGSVKYPPCRGCGMGGCTATGNPCGALGKWVAEIML